MTAKWPWKPVMRTVSWTTGFNMPGYMPDPDGVSTHATWEEARDSLIETIESHMDPDSGSEGDAVHNQQVDACDELRRATPAQSIEVYAGQFVYWLTIAEEGSILP